MAARGGKRIFRAVLWMLVALAVGYAAWTAWDLYVRPDRNIRQIYLVPRDAAVIIQTDDPIGDWKRFSASPPWQALRRAPAFAEVSAQVDALDELLRENRTLLALVGRREMLISLHKTRPDDWEALMIVDLRKAAKLSTIKDHVEQIYRLSGFGVTSRRYRGFEITEARDATTGQTLHTAFVDNHFVAGYDARLIERAIDERDAPLIGLDESFLELERELSGKGLARIYLNYATLPDFLGIYLGANPYVAMIARSMDYAGLYLQADKDRMALTGAMNLRDQADPYVAALIRSGNHRVQAPAILSARTALYAHLGFDDVQAFVARLEEAMERGNPQELASYRATRERLERYFDISLTDHFLGWMAGELAFTQSEPGLLGREPELILAIRASDISQAKKSMELLERRIKNRTPVRIRNVEYKGYPIHYIELGGFFRLFFGEMFDRFEKPYYTYIGDYVVMSNRSESLLSLIEDVEQQNTLDRQPAFEQALRGVRGASTLLTYIDMPRLHSQLRRMVSATAWEGIEAHREVLFDFPQWTLQIAGGRLTTMQLSLHHTPWVAPPPLEEAIEADSLSDREELSELRRFHVEHFEGNVLREYYPEGELRSESEVRNGRRNGRYREFYPDGKLKVRGAFRNDLPRGTWRYYSNDEKLERKERY